MVTAEQISDGVKLVPVHKLCQQVLGHRPSPPTLWRWIKRGTAAGRLEAVHIGGKWYTTPEAFAEFIRRGTEAQFKEPEQDSADDAALQAAGLL